MDGLLFCCCQPPYLLFSVGPSLEEYPEMYFIQLTPH